jgi:hypothetical protein
MRLLRTSSFRFAASVIAVAALARAPGAAAQVTVSRGVEATLAGDDVWRGITRASSLTLQPAAWIQVDTSTHTFAAGVWTAFETGRIEPGEITARGKGGGSLAELDLWAQLTERLPVADVAVGAIRYTFNGRTAGGGLGDEASTTEVYAQLWPSLGASPLIDPRATVYWDVERTHGVYLELRGGHSFSVFPFLPLTLLVDGTGGVNLRAPDAGVPARERTTRTGLTHVDLATGLGLRFDPIELHVVHHQQWSRDPATRLVRVGVDQPRRWWMETGASVTFGRERRPR